MVQSVAVATPAPGVSTTVPPLAQSVRRRRRANDTRLYTSVVFAVLSIILLIALYMVLTRESERPESPSPELTPASQQEAVASPAANS
jgi:hypothetical protein